MSQHAAYRRTCLVLSLVLGSVLVLTNVPALAAEKPKATAPRNVEPKAAQLLKQMANYLSTLQQFTVQADITEDILLDTGLTIQDGRTSGISVRRPDRLRVDSTSDLDSRQLFYDGSTITLVDPLKNRFTSLPAANVIDAALDQAIAAYNLRVPMADLLYANTYANLTEGATAGFYLGLSNVQGKSCQHLAFRKKDIDWQIWIEDSATPLPCKVLITDKKARGLQYTALLSKWNVNPGLVDSTFTFTPPANAERVDSAPTTARAAVPKPFN